MLLKTGFYYSTSCELIIYVLSELSQISCLSCATKVVTLDQVILQIFI